MTDYTDLKARLAAEHDALVRKLLGTTRPDAWAYDQDGKPVLKVGDIKSPMSEAAAAIEALEAERDEAIRRRDTWKAKAEGYDELAAAVRAKVKEEPATMSRILLKAALIDAEKQRAALEADIARMQTAHVQMQRAYDDLAAENARLRGADALLGEVWAHDINAIRQHEPEWVMVLNRVRNYFVERDDADFDARAALTAPKGE